MYSTYKKKWFDLKRETTTRLFFSTFMSTRHANWKEEFADPFSVFSTDQISPDVEAKLSTASFFFYV